MTLNVTVQYTTNLIPKVKTVINYVNSSKQF